MHLTPLPKSNLSSEDQLGIIFNPIGLFCAFFILMLGIGSCERAESESKAKQAKVIQEKIPEAKGESK